MKKKVTPTLLFGILGLIIIGISLQSYFQGVKIFAGKEYTNYNNYIIFKQSFFHLIHNQDPYELFPSEQWDLYKYSPAFALLMAPFTLLPDYLGLIIWNLLNGVLLFYAFFKFPFKTDKKKLLACGFILIEAITSLQNSQSNCLIAGLIILAYLLMEKNKILPATLLLVLSIFIKPFGLVAFALFLFYPNKIKSFAWCTLWMILFLFLPLIAVSPSVLLNVYKSWGALLANDHAISNGLSVIGWLQSWFQIAAPKNFILLLGACIFCLPLIKYKSYSVEPFRQLFLSSILIWVVIFNHKAESPTFIIAVSGIAIWYFTQERTVVNLILILIAFLFTVLSPTDLFPRSLRELYVLPYVLKAVPCIIIWAKIITEMMVHPKQLTEYKND